MYRFVSQKVGVCLFLVLQHFPLTWEALGDWEQQFKFALGPKIFEAISAFSLLGENKHLKWPQLWKSKNTPQLHILMNHILS